MGQQIRNIAVRTVSGVFLLGSGGDEIISDYAIDGKPKYEHSSFNGIFPKDLREIFPKKWKSFYYGTQRSYLMKEEMIGGMHGIETRYPFLVCLEIFRPRNCDFEMG